MNKILLVPNPNLNDYDKAIKDVCDKLSNFEVNIFKHDLSNNDGYKLLDEALRVCDLLITLGGDGSMLKVAEDAYNFDVPLLGINYGGIGYLTSLKKDELFKLNDLNENYLLEERGMLDVSVDDKDYHHVALNDVVICKSNINIPIKLLVNDDKTYFADGLIVSSATGSSAYSYSAGSPLIKEGQIILTPICPVGRASTYSIYDDDMTFKIRSIRDNRDKAFLSIDGSDSIMVDRNDLIRVEKAKRKLKIVRFKND